jgi:hypothetical protein
VEGVSSAGVTQAKILGRMAVAAFQAPGLEGGGYKGKCKGKGLTTESTEKTEEWMVARRGFVVADRLGRRSLRKQRLEAWEERGVAAPATPVRWASS